jgi:sialate O-acetylesterase
MNHFVQVKDFIWPQGQKCAVSLTYDDGCPVHLEQVVPSLNAAGIRSTFNLPIINAMHNFEKWREVSVRGHELGNHTLFHPCRKKPEQTWLQSCYDLRDYTPARFKTELQVANFVLGLIDSKKERTYGNTCCNTTLGPGGKEISMDDILLELFLAARGPFNRRIADPKAGINLMQVGHFGADAKTFNEIKSEIELAKKAGGWIVFMLHGVGKESHNLFIDKSEHDRLISWLGANKADIWTDTFLNVAKHVKLCAAETNAQISS